MPPSDTSTETTIRLAFGDVSRKRIETPNDFVSHMIEHIAWRMGLEIDLVCGHQQWDRLGMLLGKEIAGFARFGSKSAALGMIDDGGAEIEIMLGESGVELSAVRAVNIDEFIASRCEQVSSGEPMLMLLRGLAEGMSARITVLILSFEDPHHTWEGVFRGVGIALSRIFTPPEAKEIAQRRLLADNKLEIVESKHEIAVLERGQHRAVVQRGTAETSVVLSVDFRSDEQSAARIEAGKSISAAVAGIPELMRIVAANLGAMVNVEFHAKFLSSSHVVLEDIGLVLGRALLEILKLRMTEYGINGAGSNLRQPEDLLAYNVHAAISVEGRKFWRVIPETGDRAQMQKLLIVGRDAIGGLRSEDLDDFIDGLCGGLSASLMIYLRSYEPADTTWRGIFAAIGTALKEAFEVNPYRRGVPPGVKACLS